MTGLTLEEFLAGINLLGDVYGKQHAVFENPVVRNIWFKFFEVYSAGKFKRTIEFYLGHSPWFPKAPSELVKPYEESGEEERLASQKTGTYAALPPVEEVELSEEMLIENRRKVAISVMLMAYPEALKKVDLAKSTANDLTAILATCKKAQKLQALTTNIEPKEFKCNPFHDIYAYFHSGSERCRELAIKQALEPINGCQLVYRNGQVVDVKEVEF